MAFAALRELERPSSMGDRNPGIWDGILSTCYEEKPIPDLSKVIRICERHCSNAKARAELGKIPPLPTESWKNNFDACKLKKQADVIKELQPEIIWFQCPWGYGDIFKLVQGFLLSGWWRVRSGDHVCVGITTKEKYVDKYDLERVFNKSHGASRNDILEKYDFCGADTRLVATTLTFGYHHEGIKEIHEDIRNDHVTLVFRKKSSIPAQF